jgi:hypothetical protein
VADQEPDGGGLLIEGGDEVGACWTTREPVEFAVTPARMLAARRRRNGRQVVGAPVLPGGRR